jgi:16S rRNA (cytosine1402-N4)-methyltransferase
MTLLDFYYNFTNFGVMDHSSSFPHLPVLLTEVIHAFQSCQFKVFIDGTLGAGGHAEAILSSHPEIEVFLGIDQDPYALKLATERLKPWKHKTHFKHGNFSNFELFLKEIGQSAIDGIMVDLGVSSMQVDQAERGFSFSREGPLDMRMNPQQELTAAEVINGGTEQELGRIFREYGEEKKWRIAAHTIVEARKKKTVLTTSDLVGILKPIFPWNPKKGINPLTLIFQALRIYVNRELDVLEDFMDKAINFLSPQGRLAVISFHSLEDRIVKNHMRLAASDKWDTSGIGGLFQDKKPIVSVVTRKPICASEEEIEHNPRSRSAKLRVVEKLAD